MDFQGKIFLSIQVQKIDLEDDPVSKMRTRKQSLNYIVEIIEKRNKLIQIVSDDDDSLEEKSDPDVVFIEEESHPNVFIIAEEEKEEENDHDVVIIADDDPMLYEIEVVVLQPHACVGKRTDPKYLLFRPHF
ncbi:hypothetical protein RDI58_001170 [Solanum bulbocastanum]|uniref:Uncharacterized protein n=1 Tax=Solanum bulbocastanum TaxID=147425 RepID=A0AAN8YPX6_SOLBU